MVFFLFQLGALRIQNMQRTMWKLCVFRYGLHISIVIIVVVVVVVVVRRETDFLNNKTGNV
jgi:hypothetical protein